MKAPQGGYYLYLDKPKDEATTSWWLAAPRVGFTKVAEQDHGERMRKSRGFSLVYQGVDVPGDWAPTSSGSTE